MNEERPRVDTSGPEWHESHEEYCDVDVDLTEAQAMALFQEAHGKREAAQTALAEREAELRRARTAYNEQKGATATAEREADVMAAQATARKKKKRAKVAVWHHYPNKDAPGTHQPMKLYLRTDPPYEGMEQRPREPLGPDEMKLQTAMKLKKPTDEFLNVVAAAVRRMLTEVDPDGATRNHTIDEWVERVKAGGLAISAEDLENVMRERCADVAVIEEDGDGLRIYQAPAPAPTTPNATAEADTPVDWTAVAHAALTTGNETRVTAQWLWSRHFDRKLQLKGDAKREALSPINVALENDPRFFKDGKSWRLESE